MESTSTPTPPTPEQQSLVVDNVANAVRLERERVAELGTIGRAAGVPADILDITIRDGTSVADFRRVALDHMRRAAHVGLGCNAQDTMRPSGDDPSEIVNRMVEALTHRTRPTGTLSEAARPFVNLSVLDMARELLHARGERGVRMWSADRVLERAATTSDFPNLLTGVGNRVLMAAYEVAASPLKQIARRTTINDFRAKSVLRLGDMGPLAKVLEHGEITHTSRSEVKEGYSLATFARIFSLTRQAIVNDDLGAFADWNTAMGRAAAETEASELVALLTVHAGAGPTMSDTKALFHTDHGNIADTPAMIDVTSVGLGRQAMRDQVGLAGEPINVVPKFLLVSSGKETQAEQLLAALYASTVAEVNPFSGRLTLLVEPRLSGNPWYLFADPVQAPVLEYAHLSGAEGPQLASREGWNVLGVEYRCVLDFGCGVVDHRGAYRNAGV